MAPRCSQRRAACSRGTGTLAPAHAAAAGRCAPGCREAADGASVRPHGRVSEQACRQPEHWRRDAGGLRCMLLYRESRVPSAVCVATKGAQPERCSHACRGIVRRCWTWQWTAPEGCLPAAALTAQCGSGMPTADTTRTPSRVIRADARPLNPKEHTQHGAGILELVLSRMRLHLLTPHWPPCVSDLRLYSMSKCMVSVCRSCSKSCRCNSNICSQSFVAVDATI